MMSGCVYLVGAGCGDADLITVRGQELLRTCDAVIYDYLIAPDLLDSAPPNAERIYVGKRSGRHSMPQEEINALLVAKAKEFKTVVRLKGGDPYVFGRGGEEALALLESGIPFDVVPGVTSPIAIPAQAGIPVTHRGVSRSLHIITAHTADTPDGLPEYMDELARLPGTMVFLMGLNQLGKITTRLTAAGMDSATPTAVISGGNALHPVTVRGTLADIADRTAEARVQAPAVIVVGDVAGMELISTTAKPLHGIRVGLTGTDQVIGPLARALVAHGAKTYITARSIVKPRPVADKIKELCGTGHCWVVFTSANGVELFFQTLDKDKLDLRRLASCRFAVIGPATGAMLAAHGVYADLCPEEYTTRALAQALLNETSPGEPVYLFRSAKGTPALPQALVGRNPVFDVPLYDIVDDPDAAQAAKDQLPGIDYIAFASAGGVEQFYAEHGEVPDGATPVCIGPVTAKALVGRYDKPFLLAPEISTDGLVCAILMDKKA